MFFSCSDRETLIKAETIDISNKFLTTTESIRQVSLDYFNRAPDVSDVVDDESDEDEADEEDAISQEGDGEDIEDDVVDDFE